MGLRWCLRERGTLSIDFVLRRAYRVLRRKVLPQRTQRENQKLEFKKQNYKSKFKNYKGTEAQSWIFRFAGLGCRMQRI